MLLIQRHEVEGKKIKIREISEEDVDRVVEIVNENYDEVMAKVHTDEVICKFKEHNTPDNWQRQMSWKEIFVAEDAAEIIATGALANFGDDNHPKYCVSNFFVKVANHSRGVGKALFTHILNIAKSMEITSLHVPSSRSGYEFYKSMGFAEDEIQNDQQDEIIWMTLEFNPQGKQP